MEIQALLLSDSWSSLILIWRFFPNFCEAGNPLSFTSLFLVSAGYSGVELQKPFPAKQQRAVYLGGRKTWPAACNVTFWRPKKNDASFRAFRLLWCAPPQRQVSADKYFDIVGIHIYLMFVWLHFIDFIWTHSHWMKTSAYCQFSTRGPQLGSVGVGPGATELECPPRNGETTRWSAPHETKVLLFANKKKVFWSENAETETLQVGSPAENSRFDFFAWKVCFLRFAPKRIPNKTVPQLDMWRVHSVAKVSTCFNILFKLTFWKQGSFLRKKR